MFSLQEIFIFIEQHRDDGLLKEYRDSCCDNLKDLNKRSNLLSLFILIILGFYIFSSNITKVSLLGFEIAQKTIVIASPLLLSYFILEWCLIARRRRELMKMIHHIGTHIFALPVSQYPYNTFPYFNLFSMTVMPFSFLVELLNIDTESKTLKYLSRIHIGSLFTGMTIFISYTLYISFTKYPFSWQILGCNIIAAFCLMQVFLFYKSEVKTIIKVSQADAMLIDHLNSLPKDQSATNESN